MQNCDKDLLRPYNSKDTSFFVPMASPPTCAQIAFAAISQSMSPPAEVKLCKTNDNPDNNLHCGPLSPITSHRTSPPSLPIPCVP
jgi:hypothetical protein